MSTSPQKTASGPRTTDLQYPVQMYWTGGLFLVNMQTSTLYKVALLGFWSGTMCNVLSRVQVGSSTFEALVLLSSNTSKPCTSSTFIIKKAKFTSWTNNSNCPAQQFWDMEKERSYIGWDLDAKRASPKVWVRRESPSRNKLFLYERVQSSIPFQASLHSMKSASVLYTFHHAHCTHVYVHIHLLHTSINVYLHSK